MKWINIDTSPNNDDVRIIEVFCLLPRSIRNGINTEYRWLENVKIKQRFESTGYSDDGWKDVEFLN